MCPRKGVHSFDSKSEVNYNTWMEIYSFAVLLNVCRTTCHHMQWKVSEIALIRSFATHLFFLRRKSFAKTKTMYRYRHHCAVKSIQISLHQNVLILCNSNSIVHNANIMWFPLTKFRSISVIKLHPTARWLHKLPRWRCLRAHIWRTKRGQSPLGKTLTLPLLKRRLWRYRGRSDLWNH